MSYRVYHFSSGTLAVEPTEATTSEVARGDKRVFWRRIVTVVRKVAAGTLLFWEALEEGGDRFAHHTPATDRTVPDVTDVTDRPNPFEVRWHPVVNDTISGATLYWAVATAGMPVSEVDFRPDEAALVADLMDQDTATYIAELHNRELRRRRRKVPKPR